MHIKTPLIESEPLSRLHGGSVWLKLDCLQPTGSFKLRGISRVCREFVDHGATELITASAGNAGLNVAYAGSHLGVPATVVVPSSTPQMMILKIEQIGGRVEVVGDSWDESNQHALSRADGKTTVCVPAFDHPTIWHGHASLVEEVADAGLVPDAIVVSVGGGGLLCGVLEGIESVGWSDLRVVACETRGANCLARSLESGSLVTLDAIDSIAKSLGALTPAVAALEQARTHSVDSFVCTDRQALNGCFSFANDHRLIVEPACGAALASIYERAEVLKNLGSVLVVVCGGVAVSLELLRQWDLSLPSAS
jgi:L-serine/L-threonine ammonia-lyase